VALSPVHVNRFLLSVHFGRGRFSSFCDSSAVCVCFKHFHISSSVLVLIKNIRSARLLERKPGVPAMVSLVLISRT
jgi:hypothetical protein